jgi:hypothetical protein
VIKRLVPFSPPVPEIGDEVEVRVRYTATTFDRIDLDGGASRATGS